MKRTMMIAMLALAPWLLRAAEPESPTVAQSDAPEVTDPDLKDATPAMRQGTEEPVGGFQTRGLKGLSGLSLGWDGVAVLGWTSWFSDRFAFKASVGGSYSDSQSGPVVSDLTERVGLRMKVADLGGAGHLFAQLSGGARQKHSYQETQTQPTGTYTKFSTSDDYTHAYTAGLDLGAELFWPGSRRVSLEASAGLGGLWTFTETNSKVDSQPSGAITSSSSGSSGRSFEFGSRYNSLTTALNVYF